MLCSLMLSVAVHGATKNILNNIFIYSSSNCNPKLMSLKNAGKGRLLMKMHNINY